MQPFQQRVVDEKAELDEKLGKLSGFIRSDIYKGLPIEEQGRLQFQWWLMKGYSDVLGYRIAGF